MALKPDRLDPDEPTCPRDWRIEAYDQGIPFYQAWA